jgi:hypothetical protein
MRALTEIVVAYAPRLDEPWATVKTTWGDFLERMRTPNGNQRSPNPEVAKKSIPAFFWRGRCATLAKVNCDVTVRSMVGIDIDGSHTRDDIQACMTGHECILYPTYSHPRTKTRITATAYAKSMGLKEPMMTADIKTEDVARYLTQERDTHYRFSRVR